MAQDSVPVMQSEKPEKEPVDVTKNLSLNVSAETPAAEFTKESSEIGKFVKEVCPVLGSGNKENEQPVAKEKSEKIAGDKEGFLDAGENTNNVKPSVSESKIVADKFKVATAEGNTVQNVVVIKEKVAGQGLKSHDEQNKTAGKFVTTASGFKFRSVASLFNAEGETDKCTHPESTVPVIKSTTPAAKSTAPVATSTTPAATLTTPAVNPNPTKASSVAVITTPGVKKVASDPAIKVTKSGFKFKSIASLFDSQDTASLSKQNVPAASTTKHLPSKPETVGGKKLTNKELEVTVQRRDVRAKQPGKVQKREFDSNRATEFNENYDDADEAYWDSPRLAMEIEAEKISARTKRRDTHHHKRVRESSYRNDYSEHRYRHEHNSRDRGRVDEYYEYYVRDDRRRRGNYEHY
ncbi:hypothetical protein RUND412_003359 [Rhizina undulata]